MCKLINLENGELELYENSIPLQTDEVKKNINELIWIDTKLKITPGQSILGYSNKLYKFNNKINAIYVTFINKTLFQKMFNYIETESNLTSQRENWIMNIVEESINEFWYMKKLMLIKYREKVLINSKKNQEILKELNVSISARIKNLNIPNLTGCIIKVTNFLGNGEFNGRINDIIFTNNGFETYYKDLSDGQKSFLSYKCLFSNNKNNKSIVIFDEPGKFLSPNEYMKFWKQLNNYKNQIFIISHSPTFINLVNRNPNLTKFVGNGIYKRINIEKFTSSFSDIVYQEYYKTRQWKIIVQWLFFSKILFLEGITDITACLTNNKISKLVETHNINIMEIHGCKNLNNINAILNSVGITEFYILYRQWWCNKRCCTWKKYMFF